MLCKINFTQYIYKVLDAKQFNSYLPMLLFLTYSHTFLFHNNEYENEDEWTENEQTILCGRKE